MREIKFRAWDKQDKRMIVDEQEFIPVKVTNKGVFKLSPHHEENLYILVDDPSRFELMQYTGLKDKNGTGVYEGDRYRHKYYSPNWKEHLETEGVVEWDADKLQYNISGNKSAHLEVIGNKYQSKEG